jgi:geranylgeranyl pyrophosphate synthase
MRATALDLTTRAPLLEMLELSARRDDNELAEAIPQRLWESCLVGPLRDFLAVPGKQFRARLVDYGYRLVDQAQPMPANLPWLVELLHAGSLIVDDIEDGSDSRRGRPTMHRVHGVPIALNAGNWLYFYAFESLQSLGLPAQTELALHRAMSRALTQCHRGQALDLNANLVHLTQDEVVAVVRATTDLKTGALMELAACMGAVAAQASLQTQSAIARFGRELGAALQMLDDLGSVTNDSRRDKGHEDLRGARPTWPWAWAAATQSASAFTALRDQLAHAHDEACAEALRKELAQRVGMYGKAQVRTHLKRALRDITNALGRRSVVQEIEREIALLEKSYG